MRAVMSVEVLSVYVHCEHEAEKHKWIESERARRDLGQDAIRQWFHDHWHGYLRARWLEHLEGARFWQELDKGDFGLLKREFKDKPTLLNRILDRLKSGQENLDVIQWALNWNVPTNDVIEILEALDINRIRLTHKYASHVTRQCC